MLDYYAYPPPFLLAMAPLAIFAETSRRSGPCGFSLNGLLLAVGLWLVARWLDGPGCTECCSGADLFRQPADLGGAAGRQLSAGGGGAGGAGHGGVSAQQNAVGGALLAFVVLSKLSPALLGLVLLAQRRYRAVAWTAGFGVFFVALSVLSIGVNPLKYFLTYTLPRQARGRRFRLWTTMGSASSPTWRRLGCRFAAFGGVYRRSLAGGAAHRAGLLGNLGAADAGRRASVGDRRSQTIVWMSLLVLGALQTPLRRATFRSGCSGRRRSWRWRCGTCRPRLGWCCFGS